METGNGPVQASPRVSLPAKSEVVKAKVGLGVTRLFKTYLYGLEGLTHDHDEAMGKLRDALPPEYKHYVDLADYLSDDKLQRMRNGVLRNGNDLIRDIQETVDGLRID